MLRPSGDGEAELSVSSSETTLRTSDPSAFSIQICVNWKFWPASSNTMWPSSPAAAAEPVGDGAAEALAGGETVVVGELDGVGPIVTAGGDGVTVWLPHALTMIALRTTTPDRTKRVAGMGPPS